MTRFLAWIKFTTFLTLCRKGFVICRLVIEKTHFEATWIVQSKGNQAKMQYKGNQVKICVRFQWKLQKFARKQRLSTTLLENVPNLKKFQIGL